MNSLIGKFSFEENKRKYLNIKGIISRRYAYKGPDVVQIDLTDKCKSHCLACWLHSPFLQKDKSPSANELDFQVLKRNITELACIGTKEIIISGGGEPFLYPRIWDVMEFIERKGLRFRINTNFVQLISPFLGRFLFV